MSKFVGVVLALVFWTTAGFAQEAEIVATGKREFRRHCTICHGLDGKGEGIMVTLNLLTNTPPDLTQLKKRHGGTFPFWQVYRIIDGREPVKGHGTPDMPIWGDLFAMQSDAGGLESEKKATERILSLVHYLRSLQAK